MNRADEIYLVDLDLDVDLVDVDLAVSLCDGSYFALFSFGLVPPTCFICFWPRQEMNFGGLAQQCWQLLFQLPCSFRSR